MFGWHHLFNGHELEQTPGDGEGRGTCYATVHGLAKSWTRLGVGHDSVTKKQQGICITDSLCVYLKLTQHCKSAILQ